MSQENVEVVRRIFDDFLAGKLEFDSEGMLTRMAGEEYMDPDIRWDASNNRLPDVGGVYRGIASRHTRLSNAVRNRDMGLTMPDRSPRVGPCATAQRSVLPTACAWPRTWSSRERGATDQRRPPVSNGEL